jgi:hypothetical protein
MGKRGKGKSVRFITEPGVDVAKRVDQRCR